MNHSSSDRILSRGWISQPNNRGTFDILKECSLTVILCSWTVLCLNIPAPEDSWLRRKRRKLYWMILAMLGPEFILQLAMGQWELARVSVQAFKDLGHADWSLKHAFFADMGGFVLHTKKWKPFPLTAAQVHYLVAEGFVKPAEVLIDKRIIDDKNKSDFVVRLISAAQIL